VQTGRKWATWVSRRGSLFKLLCIVFCSRDNGCPRVREAYNNGKMLEETIICNRNLCMITAKDGQQLMLFDQVFAVILVLKGV